IRSAVTAVRHPTSLILLSTAPAPPCRMPFYAVKRGLVTGVFNTWLECQAQVVGFPGARYKKFSTVEEAQMFVSAPHTPPRVSTGASKKSKGPPSLATVAKSLSGGFQTGAAAASTSSTAFVATVCQDGSVVTSVARQQRPQNPQLHQQQPYPHQSHQGTKRKRSPTPPPANPPLIVYTDGACHSNGRDNSRAGIGVYFGDGHPWNVAERHPGRQTNNAAEIAAAKRAVEIAEREGVEALEVRTDSQFLISCLTAWLPKWRRNGWRLSDGGTVRVRQEIESLADLLDSTRVRVNFRHVRGHSGNHGNEMADRLANQGADAPLLGGSGGSSGGVSVA
ncbi:hypothetical protein BOX15_Mlig024557g4, partial [Macrostomum lignano]